MQQPSHLLPLSFNKPFSILGRIERDATPPKPRLQGQSFLLSVSSVGSSGMQLKAVPITWDRGEDFQYPRSDRAGCNPSPEWPYRSCCQTFQYPRSDRAGCNSMRTTSSCRSKGSFSILGRIERDATRVEAVHRVKAVHLSVSSVGSSGMQPRQAGCHIVSLTSFSILGRIERDATSLRMKKVRSIMLFQYPRSDRAGCNPLARRSSPAPGRPFSILGRIERDATPG